MTIKITVTGEVAEAAGPFPLPFLKVLASLAGRKIWSGSKSVKFDATGGNIRTLKSCDFKIEFIDKTGDLEEARKLEELATQHSATATLKTKYKPKRPLFSHMKNVLAICWERPVYAWLLEMGLCKTGICIANIGMLHLAGRVSGALILAPKGVHRQWADEIDADLDESIVRTVLVWNGREFTGKEMKPKGLVFLCMNIDAIRTDRGAALAAAFLKLHSGKSFMNVDESHNIKTGSTERTKAAIALGSMATYRRIATGTPISKNIIDAWSQFMFLDPKILGHRYMTSFRARYCIMGGFEGRQVVGQRNTEEFYGLIAPHAFRLTKAEALDLPEKIYVTREYDMGEKTKQHYQSLKKTFMTELESGEIVDVPSVAAALVRMQQVLCGYLPDENGFSHFSDERIDEMMEIISQVEGPVAIWSRFTQPILNIKERLEKHEGKGSVVTYYGATGTTERKDAVQKFLSGESRFFVSNQAAGGTGLNLQGKCQTVIYFANSFDALHRWQSEDRFHRIGMSGAVTYFDLIANKSLDKMILRNLKGKKSLSDLTLDDIRKAIVEM